MFGVRELIGEQFEPAQWPGCGAMGQGYGRVSASGARAPQGAGGVGCLSIAHGSAVPLALRQENAVCLITVRHFDGGGGTVVLRDAVLTVLTSYFGYRRVGWTIDTQFWTWYCCRSWIGPLCTVLWNSTVLIVASMGGTHEAIPPMPFLDSLHD